MDFKKLKDWLLIWSTKWIGRIAEKEPELARAIELAFYGAVLGALEVMIWEPGLALATFLSLLGAGIASALKKRARDKQEALTK